MITGAPARGLGMGALHQNLRADTILRHVPSGQRIRLTAAMRGPLATCHYVRKDGERIQRRIGWSGHLPRAEWKIENRR